MKRSYAKKHRDDVKSKTECINDIISDMQQEIDRLRRRNETLKERIEFLENFC